MTKFNVLQSSFRRGYLSKRLMGASDMEDYYQGAEVLNNFIPLPQGGIKKRTGTKFITEVGDLVEDGVGLPYRPQMAYYYGDKPCMFFTYRGDQVRGYSYSDGIYDNLVASGFEDFSLYPYQSVKFGKELVFISSKGIEPMILERFPQGDVAGIFPAFQASTWYGGQISSPSEFKWFYRTPFSESKDGVNTAGGTFGGVEIYNYSPPSSFFGIRTTEQICTPADGDVYIPIRFEDASGKTWFCVILRAESGSGGTSDHPYTYTGTRMHDPYDNFPTTAFLGTNFRVGLFNDHYGFPRSATGFQQRAVLGSTNDSPDNIFGSCTTDQRVFITPHLAEDENSDVTEVAKKYNIKGSIANTDPYVFNIASSYDTEIKWLNGSNVLYAGKLDEERIATGYDDALGPLSVSIQKKSSIGGGAQSSVAVDNGVFFITSDRKSVAFLVYNERNGQSTAIGQSTTAYGIVEEEGPSVYIKKLARDIKNSLVYAQLSNGKLIVISFNDEVGNFAWSKLEFDFEVIDIEYATHANALHLLCKYSGSDVITLEELELGSDFLTHFSKGTDDYAVTLDGASEHIGVVSGTISGFDRFANRTIKMISPEGGVQDVSVSATGEIVLPQEVSRYLIGAAITATVRTMRVSGGQEYGTTNGRPKRVDTLVCDVLNSYGGKWIDVNKRNKTELFKYDKVEQFTGQIKINPETTLEDVPQIEIIHDNTYPFILLNLVMKGTAYYD